ncbi:unnamed protein product [Caretta caretta]
MTLPWSLYPQSGEELLLKETTNSDLRKFHLPRPILSTPTRTSFNLSIYYVFIPSDHHFESNRKEQIKNN